MSEINAILREYVFFENKTQEYINKFCYQSCLSCSNVCCNAEICQEAVESPFLSIIHKKFKTSAHYNVERGWTSETGCTLFFGRPPVCYEFLCEKIIDAQPTVIHKYIIKILSKLIAYIGQNAIGRSHIVEIMDEMELERINFTRFKKNLLVAEEAFQVIMFFLKHNYFEAGSLVSLSKILPVPSTIAIF